MIKCKNGGRIVESIDELPKFVEFDELFADFETTSGDPSLKSLNPWRDCDIAGLALTTDTTQGAWYVPVGHHLGNNLPKEPVYNWWCDIIEQSRKWINHNVKYDAHVSTNWAGVLPECPLVCTLNLAKIIDSDRIMKGGYGLDALASAWLHEDISDYEARLQPYLGPKQKDYGAIPIDILGEYACQDVLTNRRLWHYEQAAVHEDCLKVWDTEIELTNVLFQMERDGLNVNPTSLAIKELQILNRLSEIDDELHAICGRSFRPHINADCYDVLCNQYGLPVLGYTDDGNPSFDKKALAQYSKHPYAPQNVVALIIEYRKLSTLYNFFVTPFQVLHVDGFLHSTYNQNVRTGRMSCKEPNSQQQSPDSKELIVPGEGNAFLACDYSQIEFRTIVHYIQDEAAIEAYLADPDTDFHVWVADMCGIPRKPAKNVNFCIGFGGGKAKVLSMLASSMDLVASLREKVDELLEQGKIVKEQELGVFNMLCKQRAEFVYNKYHATLPGLKRTSREAAQVCQRRGYVRNLRGRHRHLPHDFAHKAFNNLNQSSAADIMKERTVAVAKMLQGTPLKLVASVHDELLMRGPIAAITDPRTIRDVVNVMEHPDVEMRVPLRVGYGISLKHWRQASKEQQALTYDITECGNLEHLR